MLLLGNASWFVWSTVAAEELRYKDSDRAFIYAIRLRRWGRLS